jgi:hypothetical protein
MPAKNAAHINPRRRFEQAVDARSLNASEAANDSTLTDKHAPLNDPTRAREAPIAIGFVLRDPKAGMAASGSSV